MSGLWLSHCSSSPPERPFVSFQRHIINTQFEGRSEVVLADIDGDGLRDIVVMQQEPARLSWYRNPDWAAGALAVGARRLHDIAAVDISDTGAADLVMLGEFDKDDGLDDSGSRPDVVASELRWLENPWLPTSADRATGAGWSSHRIAASLSDALVPLDPAGNGSLSLLLIPEQGLYAPTADPRRGWSGVQLQEPWRDARAALVYDWDGDGRDDVLIARQRSVGVMALASRGRFVDWFELLATERPLVKLDVGHSGRASRRFIAGVEDSGALVVFRPNPDAALPWQREVLAERLPGVSGLQVLDLAGDGYDDVVVGLAGDGASLLVYRYRPSSRDWQPITVDSSRAGVAALATGDLSGNGYLDIIVVNASTGQIVLHQNRGLDI